MSLSQKILKPHSSNFIVTIKVFTVSSKFFWQWFLPAVIGSFYVCLAPSVGGSPQLRATASATVFVNLLDLNDNDPKFLNLPFVAEVPEGLAIGSSVFKVELIQPWLCF